MGTESIMNSLYRVSSLFSPWSVLLVWLMMPETFLSMTCSSCFFVASEAAVRGLLQRIQSCRWAVSVDDLP